MTSERVKGHALRRLPWAGRARVHYGYGCECGAECQSTQRDAAAAWHRRHKEQVLVAKAQTDG